MKLGILVNTDRHLEHIVGLAKAATEKDHEVMIFAMDDGTKLVENESFVALAGLRGIAVSVCDHSANQRGIETEGRAGEIDVGSQFNNAMMVHHADKVIVL
jgi:sulfur relay (sulfurtransferase) complex TusBCD TusD component (DsrE family)